ncbi:MAG: sigma-70 family RNA polymerase sigma factor, partial [Patulibacter sp.]
MSTEQRDRPPPPGSGRRAGLRARKALEQDYERLHQTTLNALSGKLRGQNVHFDRADLDAFYNQAWHALYAKLAAGDTIENTGAFLTQVAYFRAIDEYRKLHPDKRADVEDVGDLGSLEPDVDAQLDDAQQLREFLEGLKSRLDEREARAAALCYVHGYTRPEAAKIIGVSSARMEKLMDKVSKVVRSLTAEIESGAWCESQKSLMTAYAVNVLDPEGERYKLATVHLKECSGCRAYVRRLRGIAGVVPPIMLPFGLLGVPAAAVVGTAASGGTLTVPAAPAGVGAGA